MSPPHLNYIDPFSLLVVNPTGKIRQLFVPFKAQVILDTPNFPKNAWVFVEEVSPNNKHKLIYRVGENWWPYYVFRLSVVF